MYVAHCSCNRAWALLVGGALTLAVCWCVPVGKIREQEDDEIVDTLNRYTQKLQASLQIINSSDT